MLMILFLDPLMNLDEKSFLIWFRGIWNVIDGKAQLLLRIANQANRDWHVHYPDKVLLGAPIEVSYDFYSI